MSVCVFLTTAGYYSNKSSKLVLLSSSAAQPFDVFATSEAIQCTEVYEYARQLANADYVIPSFQSYKVLYATRLAEHGRCAEALQYCEAVATTLVKGPSTYAVSMMKQVAELGSMLKFSDPQLLTETDGAAGGGDAHWVTALQGAIQSKSPVSDEPVYDTSAYSQPPSMNEQPYSVDYQYQQQQQQQQPPQQFTPEQQQQQHFNHVSIIQSIQFVIV